MGEAANIGKVSRSDEIKLILLTSVQNHCSSSGIVLWVCFSSASKEKLVLI